MLGYTYLVFQMLRNENGFNVLKNNINSVYNWHFYATIINIIVGIVIMLACFIVKKHKIAGNITSSLANNLVYGTLAIILDSLLIKSINQFNSFSEFSMDRSVTILLGLFVLFYWQTTAWIITRKDQYSS